MKNNIELRTGEIEELLSSTPSWLVRWGITIFFGIIAMAIVFCCFFKYPEIISAPITITTEHPAVWVVAKNSGKIDSILVQNNQAVREVQVLAIINNTCKFNSVVLLNGYLDSLSEFIETLDINHLRYCEYKLELGDMQDYYSQLIKLLAEYETFDKNQFHNVTQKGLLNEIKQHENYKLQLANQKKLLESNVVISNQKLNRDSLFFAKKMIQASEYERTQQQLISSHIELSAIELSASSTDVNIARLEQQINGNSIDFQAKYSAYKAAIIASYDKLKVALALWDSQYVLKSPVTGVISFSNIWSRNQNINAGDRIFAVLSDSPGRIIGKSTIPVAGTGKLRRSQPVVIKLDNYPFMEFGIIKGVLANLSKIPDEIKTEKGILKYTIAEIELSEPLVTSYQKHLPFDAEMTGTAEIVIEDLTLMQHFFSPLKYLWKDRLSNGSISQ